MPHIRFQKNTPGQPCALAIGVFDGIHQGHQALIARARQRATEHQLASGILCFEPYPRQFFRPDEPLARLSSVREKLLMLKAGKIDFVCLKRFDRALAELSAEAFIDEILCQELNVRQLIIGDDFCFGKDRRGDFQLLQRVGQIKGFAVEQISSVLLNEQRVSSTAVRAALADGNMALAENMLGRPYSILGRVMHGDKIGRTLGFPTANIQPQRRSFPLQGIFSVLVDGLGDKLYQGVASIGTRPVVNNHQQLSVEVHVFDYNGNCYGKMLEVCFLKKHRDEQYYPCMELLRQQIYVDAEQARNFFSTHQPQLPKTLPYAVIRKSACQN